MSVVAAAAGKYDESRIEISQDLLKSEWTATEDELGISLAGVCPACLHRTQWVEEKREIVDVGSSSVLAFREFLPADDLDGLTVRVTCDCQQGHEGRDNSKVPSGTRGCGRFWYVTASRGAEEMTLSPTADPKLIAAVSAARYTANSELEKVRASAGKWIGGTAALFGLFSLSGTALGSDSVRKLTPGAVQLFVILLSGAALVAGLAVLLGYVSAYGWPRSKNFSTDREVLQRHREWKEAPEKAANLLKVSVILGVISLLLLIVVAIVVRVAPLASVPEPVLRLTLADGSQPCGTALPSTEDSVVRLLRPDGSVVTSHTNAVRRLESPATC